MIVKAQVLRISPQSVAVAPVQGRLKEKVYGLPFREGVVEGQFVDIDVHPSEQRAEWPPAE